jgi:hypothetical protein
MQKHISSGLWFLSSGFCSTNGLVLFVEALTIEAF